MKRFTHNDLDPNSKCGWTITHDDTGNIEDGAAEHLLSCESGYSYREDSGLLRATIRAVVRSEDTAQGLNNCGSNLR